MNSGAAVLIDEPVNTWRATREARVGIGVKYFSSASEMFEELDRDDEEESEDIMLFDARKDEPTVPLSKIIENYQKKYGSLN